MGIGFSGGSGGSLVFLGETVLVGAGNSIDLQNISTGYRQLKVFVQTIYSAGGANTVTFILNNDSAANYSYTNVYGTAAAASSQTQAAVSSVVISAIDASKNGNAEITIFQLPSSINRSFISIGGFKTQCNFLMGEWANTTEISRITVATAGTFAIGSKITVYGIK